MTHVAHPTVPPPPSRPGAPGPPPGPGHPELRWSHHGGTEVAVKVAAGAQRRRLRREAEVLRRLAGRRVPRVVEVIEAADHTEVVMERHGALTLADAALIDLAERRAALRSLCAALGELHRAGWAHGRLEPRHVLVDPRGRVRLCSLADAVELADGGPDALATDLCDLSTTVLEVLTAEAGFHSAFRRWRWDRAARRARRRISGTRGMLTTEAMAELCATELPATRPLRPLARPGPTRRRSTRGPSPRRPSPRRGARSPVVRMAAVGAVLLAGAYAAHACSAGPPWGAPVADRPPASTAAPSSSRGGSARSPDASTRTTAAAVDEAGDGTLVVDGIRYRVGAPGDVVVVGDWNCDGLATPAVFRPSTGSVFAYDTWADGGGPTRAHAIGRAPGAAGIRPAEACGAPRVEWPDGSLRPLEEDP